jgi:predicted O-linked N-acetylglucosamine transferase (SPINDLY family)
LASHDRGQFQVYCYADVAGPDPVTARLRNGADIWRPIAAMSDQAVADLIRADRIDILVDLTMHMGNARPLVLARKPAPLQVAYLAYPGTTGLTSIDYRLTDPYLDPPGQYDDCYTEQSIRLPHTFWCYDPLATDIGTDPPPQPGPLPAMANGYVTFGCLNNFCKLNDGVLELFSRVLGRVDRSRLLLLAPHGQARQRTLDRLARGGVADDRVQFVDLQPRRDYLAEYRRIDIGLDTLPYNGHTTSLDSLWMGVPVVTRVGATVVARAGLSQLSNLALTELIAWSDEQFVEIAVQLAGDLPRAAELRRTLRPRMMASPLTDADQMARHIEAVYRSIWRNFAASSP